MKSVSIIGSCVSRDGYELLKDDISLDFYAARTSLLSIYGGRSLNIPCTDLVIDGKGKFETKMLSYDINITTRDLVESTKSDYIIFDAIDERFDIYDVNGTYVTRSNYLLNTRYGESLEKSELIKRNSNEMRVLWKKAADEFIHATREKNVIIHRAFWAKRYKNHDSHEVLEFPADKLQIAVKYNS